MPLFHYRAVTNQGVHYTGEWYGSSQDELCKLLLSKNDILIKCKIISTKHPWWQSSITYMDLASVCLHLEQLCLAGFRINQAIGLLSEQTARPALRAILKKIHNLLDLGYMLSHALQCFNKVFSPIFIHCISIAETTGGYARAFALIRNHLTWQNQIQQQRKNNLRYPLLLLSVISVTLLLFGGYFVPNLAAFLQDNGVDTKSFWALRSMMALNNHVEYVIAFVSFVLVVSGFITAVFMTKKLQQYLANIILKIPFVGRICYDFSCSQLFKNLATLLNGGVGLVPAIKIASQGDCFFAKNLLNSLEKIEQGATISNIFSDSLSLSPIMKGLFQLAEETGKLAEILDQAANMLTEQVQLRINILLSWTQPILLIIMGSIIVWVILATVVPLYENLANFAA